VTIEVLIKVLGKLDRIYDHIYRLERWYYADRTFVHNALKSVNQCKKDVEGEFHEAKDSWL